MPLRHVFIVVITLYVSAVYADDLVDRADINGDGFVSLYELRAAHYADIEFNKQIEESFASYDSDGDGLISEAERRAKPDDTAAAISPPDTGLATGSSAAGSVAIVPATGATLTSTGEEPKPATSAGSSTMGMSDDGPATNLSAVAPVSEDANRSGGGADKTGLSRTKSLMLDIDADNSGGASVAELIASGDGNQWFTDGAFDTADKNGDGDLDPAELEVLLQSLERRRR